mgnify:CR=1 FL=1
MKISIASTFYNDKKMMKLVLDSVLSQDYSNIEHIVADGGSTDGSVELLQEYEKLYEQAGKTLIWKSERDKGMHDGITKALSKVTGDYLMVGTDPYYDSHTISSIVENITQNDLDYSYGGMVYQRDGVITRSWSGKPGNWRLGWMMANPTLCMKRELYEKYGPYDKTYLSAADYKFQVRLFMDKTLKSKSLNKPLVLFYAGGASNNDVKAKMLSIKENFRTMREYKVPFGWFTVLCKIAIALFAYTFHSHKKIAMEEKS